MTSRIAAFEENRAHLIALAYRMLGDLARAEDLVQDAWLRWERHDEVVRSPRAFLVTIVTRLCLTELATPRVRREEARSDRLPEPIDLSRAGLEQLEHVSMALLVALQRLSPAERAVVLLHEVFELSHQEIGALVGTSVEGSRKLLERARRDLASERRLLATTADEHRRLLGAFLDAVNGGDVDALVRLLADDVVLTTDGGARGRTFAGRRNLSQPLDGAARVAAFVIATTSRVASSLRVEPRDVNGQPSLVLWAGAQPVAAILLAVCDGRIARIYFHADEARLRHLGAAS